MHLFRRKSIPVFFVLLLLSHSLVAKVTPGRYGLPAFTDSVHLIIDIKTAASTDSVLKAQPQLSNTNSINGMATEQKFTDKTADFYLVLFLFVVLGFIRVTDPKYFQSLWQAFKNPSTSSRQLREKLQNASVPNLLMNIFFTMSAAAYAYYVVRNFMPQRSGNIAPSLLLLMLIGGMVAIYLGKYAVIKFSGWSFRVESITEHYLFNVFLVNKILAIILLPFIVLLAFATPVIAQPALIVSFILTLVLFVNRYLRSWQVFGSFFQYSKFHFFTYLCASELLPLAVLMKLLVRGLLY